MLGATAAFHWFHISLCLRITACFMWAFVDKFCTVKPSSGAGYHLVLWNFSKRLMCKRAWFKRAFQCYGVPTLDRCSCAGFMRAFYVVTFDFLGHVQFPGECVHFMVKCVVVRMEFVIGCCLCAAHVLCVGFLVQAFTKCRSLACIGEGWLTPNGGRGLGSAGCLH